MNLQPLLFVVADVGLQQLLWLTYREHGVQRQLDGFGRLLLALPVAVVGVVVVVSKLRLLRLRLSPQLHEASDIGQALFRAYRALHALSYSDDFGT